MGWANSSLRRLDQLPALPALAASARGVVLEDPLGASLAPSLRGVSRGNSEDHGPQGGSPLGAALREGEQRGAAALQGSREDSQGASLLQAGSGRAHVPPAQASRGCTEGSRQDMQGLGSSGAASGPHSSSGRAPGGSLAKNISGPSGPLGALRLSSSSSGAAGAQRRGDAANALAGTGADGGWSGGWSSGALIQRGLELMQNAQVSGAGLAERLSTRLLHRSHCCACLLCLLGKKSCHVRERDVQVFRSRFILCYLISHCSGFACLLCPAPQQKQFWGGRLCKVWHDELCFNGVNSQTPA